MTCFIECVRAFTCARRRNARGAPNDHKANVWDHWAAQHAGREVHSLSSPIRPEIALHLAGCSSAIPLHSCPSGRRPLGLRWRHHRWPALAARMKLPAMAK